MIRKIAFSNFYSFKGLQEISFLANEKKTSYDYAPSVQKGKITKVAAFIGGNASGKTNVMRAFGFLGFFVTTVQRAKEWKLMQTFFESTDPSDFSLEFEYGEFVYIYELRLQNLMVLRESLSRTNANASSEVIFLREGDAATLHERLLAGVDIKSLESVRQDVSWIAYMKSIYDIPVINEVFGYFSNISTNISEDGSTDTENSNLHAVTASLYLQEQRIRERMEDFIRHFDLGIQGFDFEMKQDESGSWIRIFGKHVVGEQEKKLLLPYESRGTRSLFGIAARIFVALERQGVAVIDELETGLHTEALSRLVQYFIDENADGRAQLIFSTHLLEVMRRLDMHQIYLVSKNARCESHVKRLNEVEGVRTDANHLAKYLSGAYDAFPNITV